MDRIAGQLPGEFAAIFLAGPAQEDVNRLIPRIAEKLAAEGKVRLDADLLRARFSPHQALIGTCSA